MIMKRKQIIIDIMLSLAALLNKERTNNYHKENTCDKGNDDKDKAHKENNISNLEDYH